MKSATSVIREGDSFIVTLSCAHVQLLSARGAARAIRAGAVCGTCERHADLGPVRIAEYVATVYETTLEALVARRLGRLRQDRALTEPRRAAALAMRWAGASVADVGRILDHKDPRHLLSSAYQDKSAVAEANSALAVLRR